MFIFVKVLGRVKLFGGGVRLMGKGGFFWSVTFFGKDASLECKCFLELLTFGNKFFCYET